MNCKQFIETIKVKDGIFYNLPLHAARMQKTAEHFFGMFPKLCLSPELIPENLRHGLVKCRVLYDRRIISVTFEPYSFRVINKLRLIENDQIDYTYKSAERSLINSFLIGKQMCDDILIVKNGLITDTSFSNVVFEQDNLFYTPDNCLLKGIKREYLLNKGIITEKKIGLGDIPSYSRVYLINSMIDLEDNISLPTSRII